MQTRPFRDLAEESLDEAHFLWRRWEQELASLTRNLDEVYSWTEDRLQGALDGVRVLPAAEFESLLAAGLASDDRTHVTVAAHLLATAKAESSRALLCESVRTAAGKKLTACVRGFALADLDGSFASVTGAMLAAGPEQRAALCNLKAFRRVALGQEWVDSYQSKIPALQAQAIQAAAFLSSEQVSRNHADAWIKAGLHSPDAIVRTAAIVTGIRRRNSEAWHSAVQLVRMAHEDANSLLNCVAMFGSSAERQAVVAAADAPTLNKSALQALGTLGTREAIERCLLAMRDEALARIAGESYCAITGVDLERDGLVAAEKEAATPSFEADDLDADLVPHDAATWPLPDIDAVQAHWTKVQSRFAPGLRYVGGRIADVGTLMTAIEAWWEAEDYRPDREACLAKMREMAGGEKHQDRAMTVVLCPLSRLRERVGVRAATRRISP